MSEFLLFNAGGESLAVGASHVCEVVRAAALSSSGTSENLEGVLNLRGDAVPVVDLECTLGIQQPALAPSDFLIILQSSDGSRLVIRSNSEVKLAETAVAAQSDAAQSDAAATRRFVDGFIRDGTRLVGVINPDSLMDSASASRGVTPHGGIS